MTLTEQLLTVGLCVAATLITRFAPFLVFSPKRKTPAFVLYLGKALPPALFGMLVVYCLKSVDILGGAHGLPELIALIVVVLLHLWKRQLLLSVVGGTVCYMLLVQLVF